MNLVCHSVKQSDQPCILPHNRILWELPQGLTLPVKQDGFAIPFCECFTVLRSSFGATRGGLTGRLTTPVPFGWLTVPSLIRLSCLFVVVIDQAMRTITLGHFRMTIFQKQPVDQFFAASSSTLSVPFSASS